MTMSRLHVRQILEILRLRFTLKHSYREIASSVNCATSSIGECLQRFSASGLSWPLADEITESELEALLYPVGQSFTRGRLLPDWQYIHLELKKKSVTLMLLWLEYKKSYPDGYQYTQFCNHYNAWAKKTDVVFTNNHNAGEKVFLDYAGQTIPIWDVTTGESRQAQIFLGVLGASSYTYAEATWTQSSSDWLSSNRRMFNFFGGVAAIWVPDNLKSAVTTPCRYDPIINTAYYAMAKHYDASVIPARAKKPRDKAKVEAAVLHVERRILAKFRNQKFFSLEELNEAIQKEVECLNNEKFQKLEGSRKSIFETIEKPALKPLPTDEYIIRDYKMGRVHINYHIQLEQHHYSVPYTFVQKEILISYTSTKVEVSYKGQTIASHLRRYTAGYTTLEEHMPTNHQAHVKWSPARMINWVGEAGPCTSKVAETIIASRKHPEASYNTILGLIRLGEKHGKDRLENACTRAVEINSMNYRSIKNILNANLDKSHIPKKQNEDSIPLNHRNIRGREYFN
jgi:transposase